MTAKDTTYLTARQDLDLHEDELQPVSDEESHSVAQKFAPKIAKADYEGSQHKYNPELAIIQTPAEEEERDFSSLDSQCEVGYSPCREYLGPTTASSKVKQSSQQA